jgi:hypothetical protein
MQYFWYSLLTIALLYASCLGFTILLLPDSLSVPIGDPQRKNKRHDHEDR